MWTAVDYARWAEQLQPRDSRYTVAMLVARRFVVKGHVQGVGFRFFAREAAEREGLSGSARNLFDGSVEVLAEGDREAVDRFESKIRRGPSRARVEHVTVEETSPSGHSGRPGAFTIRE